MKLRELKEDSKIHEGSIIAPVEMEKLEYTGLIVAGNFSCSASQIKSLEGAPEAVTGYFNCSRTGITSLVGGPRKVGGKYEFSFTGVRSMKGCAQDIGGDLYFENVPMTSLKDIHKSVKRIGEFLYIPTTIRSNILGILYIRDLRTVYFSAGPYSAKLIKATAIINKHLRSGSNPADRDIHKAQEEMLEAGLGVYAQL